MDRDEALDALYATSPDRFVEERNALAKRLRAEKAKDDAASVAALRRPARPVWLLNRLALSGGDEVPALVAAVAGVRTGNGPAVRTAMADLRTAIREATRAALSGVDEKPTDRTDVESALHALVGSPEALDLLAAGRLLELPGAGVGGFDMPAEAPVPSAARARAGTSTGARGDLESALAEATDALATTRADAEEAAAQVASETDHVDAARAATAEAEAALETARSDLATAEESLSAAQEALDTARGRSADAAEQVAAAEEHLERDIGRLT